jgi:hypothetical protein
VRRGWDAGIGRGDAVTTPRDLAASDPMETARAGLAEAPKPGDRASSWPAGAILPGMACVRVAPTPNPNAMKFTLDITLPERILANRGDHVEDGFTAAVLATPGVASVFGVNDFVTVTRVPGSDWDPIVCAVEEAAATHLPGEPAGVTREAVERARALLREALTSPVVTPVEIQPDARRRRDP